LKIEEAGEGLEIISAETTEVSLDLEVMDEKLEEIDDSLEDLLIFPTRKGLLRSMEKMEAYFAMEVELMKQRGLQSNSGRRYQSAVEEQQAILDIAKNELNNRSQVGSASCCNTG
jgi:hypothetical protein